MNIPEQPPIHQCAWLFEEGRTPQFQAFLDSLESKEVKRILVAPINLGSTWATSHFNPQ